MTNPLTLNQRVVGSSPTSPTIFFQKSKRYRCLLMLVSVMQAWHLLAIICLKHAHLSYLNDDAHYLLHQPV